MNEFLDLFGAVMTGMVGIMFGVALIAAVAGIAVGRHLRKKGRSKPAA